jgi:predicted GNAT superfamily acetyltransferase
VIEIRNCAGFEELDACVQLEIETWGYDAHETVPRKEFLLMQKIGGQVIGAFDSSEDGSQRLIGFVMAMAGVKSGPGDNPRAYLHSHMLAVRPEYRNSGVGAGLKREQRREALARGLTLMEWTFDPLEIKNAYLNLCKLGATVRRYQENFYGNSSSLLQGGLPTDRLVAEWQMDAPRVEAALAGKPPAGFAVEERIHVPAAIYEWKATENGRERARALQLKNRQQFQQAFARGLAVLGFARDAEGNGTFELGLPPHGVAGS